MREKKSHSRKCVIATKRLSCHSLLTSSGFCAIFIIRTANECLDVNLRREERRKPWKGGKKGTQNGGCRNQQAGDSGRRRSGAHPYLSDTLSFLCISFAVCSTNLYEKEEEKTMTERKMITHTKPYYEKEEEKTMRKER
jgi:hypothetical protein